MTDETTTVVANYWAEFLRIHPEVSPETAYQSWRFGDGGPMADELAGLVVAGKKIATASLYWEYEAEDEALPQTGGFSVILNSLTALNASSRPRRCASGPLTKLNQSLPPTKVKAT